MNFRERLKEILCEKSVRTGNFVLTSGKTSNFYVDARLTTLDAEGSYCAGMVLLDLFKNLNPYPKAIGGLTMGADPIVAVVAALSFQHGSSPVSGFLVRKEAKKHGMQQYLEGYKGAPGEPVVIVDDVCTTGGSTLLAIERARAARLEVIAAFCLVDREEGGRENIEKVCPFRTVFTATELMAALPASSVIASS